jgi:hypothetical protein
MYGLTKESELTVTLYTDKIEVPLVSVAGARSSPYLLAE